MMSLFSSFDIFFYHFSIISFIIPIFFICLNFSHSNYFFNSYVPMFLYLISFFKGVMNFKFKIFDIFVLSVMSMILFFNWFSIISFYFPISSEIFFGFLLSLNAWLAIIFFYSFSNINSFLIHLIPEGCPLPLTWFLFLVEFISSLIRPITLMVRLMANILAGHLLMVLLSMMVFLFPPFFVLYLGLNLVEFLVSIIQCYIFVTMITLYFSEIH